MSKKHSADTPCRFSYAHSPALSFAESALGGLIVSESDPKSLAAQEIKNLTEELLAFYGKKDGSNSE